MAANPERTRHPMRMTLSRLAHSAPWVFGLVCASTLIRTATNTVIPEPFGTMLITWEVTAVIVSAAAYAVHTLRPCLLCQRATPPDGEKVAHERYMQLQVHHLPGLDVTFCVLMGLNLVLGELVLGPQATLILMAVIGTAMAATWHSSITHSILSRWCSQCDHEPAGKSAD